MQTTTATEGSVVEREDRNGVAILRINRPQQLNALNPKVLEALDQHFRELETAPDIHGIILTGAGDKAFSAGADLLYMRALTAVQARELAQRGQSLLFRIENHPKPVVAAVNGYAFGGGMEIAMACDFIVAAESARFGQPEVTIGVTPGFAGSQRLARLVGKAKAKELCMTGEPITAEEAYRIGLAVRLVAKERLQPECEALLQKIHANAPVAVRLVKDAINRGVNMPLEAASALEADAFALCFATEDQKEGMRAFLEKRKPNYVGR